ncbi:MAG: LysM peptidoglycan-binding domain-containing protein [Lewinellaceae bacterium]|nr:LysM peptidoglycan-binding domain-containing protein [Lewinellaceae bacterium]
MFSISRYYNIGLEELFEYNPDFRNDPTLRIGARVKIPIPNKAIKRYKSSSFVASPSTMKERKIKKRTLRKAFVSGPRTAKKKDHFTRFTATLKLAPSSM